MCEFIFIPMVGCARGLTDVCAHSARPVSLQLRGLCRGGLHSGSGRRGGGGGGGGGCNKRGWGAAAVGVGGGPRRNGGWVGRVHKRTHRGADGLRLRFLVELAFRRHLGCAGLHDLPGLWPPASCEGQRVTVTDKIKCLREHSFPRSSYSPLRQEPQMSPFPISFRGATRMGLFWTRTTCVENSAGSLGLTSINPCPFFPRPAPPPRAVKGKLFPGAVLLARGLLRQLQRAKGRQRVRQRERGRLRLSNEPQCVLIHVAGL